MPREPQAAQGTECSLLVSVGLITAGMGWSEAGPLPRTAAQFAKELHILLQHADIPGPYVLVGHSLGGLSVRVFAHAYAADVAGVVLIESMNP